MNPADLPDDPFALFRSWMAEAEASEPYDANAMALATTAPSGEPSVRMVLLKGATDGGFSFYTNMQSRKAEDLQANPRAALLFHWKSLRRQIRIEGRTEPVADADADRYFATRARGSRLGAWASEQSRPLGERAELEARVAKFDTKYGEADIPRPPHWSGFRVVPARFEFWIDRRDRLHERYIYERTGAGDWRTAMLQP